MQAPKKAVPIKDALRAKTELAANSPAPIDAAAVEQGRKPLPARRKDVDAIRARVLELYAIPAAGLPAIPAIDSQFKFAPLDTDRNFHFLHVEALLDQAAGLLERCATVKAQHGLLHAESFKLQLELDALLRLDGLHGRERQAGLDTVPYERAVLDSAAEKSLEENHHSAGQQRKALFDDLMASGFNKQMAARELAAWMSAYPLKDQQLTGDDASYTFDGARRSKPDHLFEAARMEADVAAWEQASTLMAERFTSTAESEAAHWRKASLDSQSKWALADISFRGERAQIASDHFWEKAFQAQAAGGGLNLSERVASVERLFAFEFREALACLAAARRGLTEIYGYAPPFPEEGAPSYFDQVSMWVRAARAFVAQFGQLDQEYVLAASVKQLTKGSWDAGRAAAEWTFDVPADLFRDQAHVRLRGIGLAVVGPKPEPQPGAKASAQKGDLPKPEPTKPEGFWHARITLPAKGAVRTLAGAAVELDQSSVPVCFLGRVSDSDGTREPERAGGSMLRNASPIGAQWKLAISPTSTGGTETKQLDDVQIFLHVAVRGVKA